MAKVKEAGSDSVAVEEIAPDSAFYHVGLIPASGPVSFVDPTVAEGALKKMDAWTLWTTPEVFKLEKGMNFFVPKCRHFLGLSVRGFHFPSTSEYVEMSKTGASRMPFPGGVAKLDDDQVERIVRSCYRHVIRFKNGFDRIDDPTQPVEIIDLDFGTKPVDMSDAEWSTYKAMHPVPSVSKFNPKTDKYVAEFVFIQKLVDERTGKPVEVDSSDYEAYSRNPNRFHFQWVGPVKRDFFEAPPKSVLEMYPKA